MHRFELWAPDAAVTRVDVVVGDAAYPMARDEQGVWAAEVAAAGFGSTYRFRLNGDPAESFADPRSHCQAEGSFGASTLVDHGFRWTDAGWSARPLAEAVLYELHIGTFTPAGTYAGAVEKLSYLRDLGVTHIEMMPVHQASGSRGWGYDGTYLFAPYAAYGSPAELRAFVDAAHGHDIAVILDVVYNHFGPEGNHTGRFGPYTKPEPTPWGDAINLDGPGSDHVRGFIIDNALMWLEHYHLDGLRIDAMDELRDRSAFHLMEELGLRVAELGRRTGRRLILTAEFDQNDPRVVTEASAGGLGLDAQWVDNFHHALLTVLTGDRRSYYHDFGSIELLAKALRQAIVFDGQFSAFRNKRLGRSYGHKPPDRFIVFSANHDQIGNRPLGERPSHRIGHERAKIAAALTILSRFVPMLFQGEEWHASTPFQYFTDHRDPAIADATVKGRGGMFGDYGLDPGEIPNPQKPETFERSKLDWEERLRGPHRAALEWHRSLLRLRHATPDFGRSRAAEVRFDAEAGWITMAHSGIAVLCNLAQAPQAVPVPAPGMTLLLASQPGCVIEGDRVDVPGDGVAVLGPAELGAIERVEAPIDGAIGEAPAHGDRR